MSGVGLVSSNRRRKSIFLRPWCVYIHIVSVFTPNIYFLIRCKNAGICASFSLCTSYQHSLDVRLHSPLHLLIPLSLLHVCYSLSHCYDSFAPSLTFLGQGGMPSFAAPWSLSLSYNVIFSSPIVSTASSNLAAHFTSTSCHFYCKAYTCLCGCLNLLCSFAITAYHSTCSFCAVNSCSTSLKLPSALGGGIQMPQSFKYRCTHLTRFGASVAAAEVVRMRT